MSWEKNGVVIPHIANPKPDNVLREKRLLFSLSENHQQFPDTINSYRRTFFIPVGNVDQITFIFVRTPKGNLVSFTFIWANSTWLWFLKELYPLRVSLFSPWAKTHALQLPCPFFVNFYKNIAKKKEKEYIPTFLSAFLVCVHFFLLECG